MDMIFGKMQDARCKMADGRWQAVAKQQSQMTQTTAVRSQACSSHKLGGRRWIEGSLLRLQMTYSVQLISNIDGLFAAPVEPHPNDAARPPFPPDSAREPRSKPGVHEDQLEGVAGAAAACAAAAAASAAASSCCSCLRSMRRPTIIAAPLPTVYNPIPVVAMRPTTMSLCPMLSTPEPDIYASVIACVSEICHTQSRPPRVIHHSRLKQKEEHSGGEHALLFEGLQCAKTFH